MHFSLAAILRVFTVFQHVCINSISACLFAVKGKALQIQPFVTCRFVHLTAPLLFYIGGVAYPDPNLHHSELFLSPMALNIDVHEMLCRWQHTIWNAETGHLMNRQKRGDPPWRISKLLMQEVKQQSK